MKTIYDLSQLDWRVAGFLPHAWRFESNMAVGTTRQAETLAVPVGVPGSVQQALVDAGLVPHWEVGLNARQAEWVENRHWVYEVTLPGAWLEQGTQVRLHCMGLDGNGLIRINAHEVATFDNSFLPYTVDLTPHLHSGENRLQIIFECPPRWLGQFGYTSRMTEWKPRFNYSWDWTARLVQIGIWDGIQLEVVAGAEIETLHLTTDADPTAGTGMLQIRGQIEGVGAAAVRCALESADGIRRQESVSLAPGTGDGDAPTTFELRWEDLHVALWWPNGYGEQPLYTLTVTLLDDAGEAIDTATRTVGFRHVEWQPCAGAPEDADPWLCVVNGQPIFLQGVNWVPIRPNFADVSPEAYAQRLRLYRDLHMNVLRVWGGAVLERETFYDLCDRLGLLVWQEFPLSSSGFDNYAPEDAQSIADQTTIARSYIRRRQHHASLLLWCGGNELTNNKDGRQGPDTGPLGLEHPMLRAFADVVAELDPTRRFLPTSAQGPSFSGNPEDWGKGLHWDVHGPWKLDQDMAAWRAYWAGDDALFRSEVGCPGPSSADLIRRYAGDCDPYPGDYANPLWRRTGWWIEWPQYTEEIGREPETLEAYVAWGQQRQAEALRVAAQACKDRFPACGGFIVWMGHDCFPCTANTSVIDFEGHPKPAAFALAEVFGRRSE